MDATSDTWAEVDEQGRLVIPLEQVSRLGLHPGARVRLEAGRNDLRLHRPVTHLNKVYIEPTNHCNIDCVTCMRNSWEVPMGRMSEAVFSRILAGLEATTPTPSVFFGGIGEPTSHPRIVEMVRRCKELGATVELITNGTLLNERRARGLIEAGLDVLWVSIDGATPESYADVRLGAQLPLVLENMERFHRLRRPGHRAKPEMGINFVAMKRNIADLPTVIATCRRLGVTRFMVSNVLPYTPELCDEMLYERTLRDITYSPSPWLPRLSMPKMDLNETTQASFLRALQSGANVTFAGNNLGGANDVCTFIESGSTTVGWDGRVSPCIPLLHDHVSYLHRRERHSKRHTIGSLVERELLELWNDPEYVAYRSRIQNFAFSPCTMCGGCEMSASNEEDCLGNTFPVCGGCLWAQAVIQCP
jgi:MoaA/NifB/PqqE/SkfB family radical SAM enzyme